MGTVFRIKRRLAEDGLEGVLWDRPQANRYRKLDDRGEAHLIALACSAAPEGHGHWTLRLLAGKAVELGLVSSLSHESAPALEKNALKPWRKKEWCIPTVSAAFVARAGYAEPQDPQRPVVCFDETSTRGRHPSAAARKAGGRCGRTTSTGGRGPARTLGRLAARGGHRTANDAGLRPADALWWITRKPRWCGWCWTTNPPPPRPREDL